MNQPSFAQRGSVSSQTFALWPLHSQSLFSLSLIYVVSGKPGDRPLMIFINGCFLSDTRGFEWCPFECSGHILRIHSDFSSPDDFISINPRQRNQEYWTGTKGADHACLRMSKSNPLRSGWTLLFPLKVERCTIRGPVALWRLAAGETDLTSLWSHSLSKGHTDFNTKQLTSTIKYLLFL